MEMLENFLALAWLIARIIWAVLIGAFGLSFMLSLITMRRK